jgi:hypothetical protein
VDNPKKRGQKRPKNARYQQKDLYFSTNVCLESKVIHKAALVGKEMNILLFLAADEKACET